VNSAVVEHQVDRHVVLLTELEVSIPVHSPIVKELLIGLRLPCP
jgi:hypothetical protein